MPTFNYKLLARLMRERERGAGYIARKLGVSRQSIHALLAGKTADPRGAVVLGIAALLDVEPSVFYAEEVPA